MTEKQLMDAVVDAAKQLSTLQDALADYCLRTNKESLTVAEPASQWIPVSERLLDAYAQISKGAERMSNRDCKHGQLARSCNICELEEEVNEKAKTIAALEQEVEALRSLLSDVTCVAITMLYDTHKQDVLDVFTLDELKEVVRRSEHLQIAKVEHIYRRGFEALAGGEAG